MPPVGCLELKPGDASDPDGCLAGSVLAAALDVERSATTRRRVVRRLAVIGLLVYLVEATTPFVPRSTFLVDLTMLAAIAGASLTVEWSKRCKLRSAIAASRAAARL